MTIETIKRMMDACYLAKRARDLLPPLPDGVTPAYIQYLDVIRSLEKQGVHVRVSDISAALDLPRPGVTRTVKEMEAKGYLQKSAAEEDGRVTYLSVTQAGIKLHQEYDTRYFSTLAPFMAVIPEEDAECTIHTIETFHKIMSERRNSLEKR